MKHVYLLFAAALALSPAAGLDNHCFADDVTPVDVAPVDVAPVDAAPVDVAPVDVAPVDVAPVDVAPVDAAPVDAAPVDAGDGDTDAQKPVLTRTERAKKEYGLGMMMINHKRYDKAVEHLEKARKLNPGNYNTHLLLGKIYTRVNRAGDSIKSFRTAIKIDPSLPDAYDSLMQLFVFMNRMDKSLETAESAVKAGIDRVALPDLGWTYYQLNRLDEAEACYNEYIEHYGESFGAYRNLGLVYYTRGDYEKAVEYYKKAEELEKDNISLPYLAAMAYKKLDMEREVWIETGKYRERDKQHMANMPKFDKLYLPHAEPVNIGKYIYLIRDDAAERMQKRRERLSRAKEAAEQAQDGSAAPAGDGDGATAADESAAPSAGGSVTPETDEAAAPGADEIAPPTGDATGGEDGE